MNGGRSIWAITPEERDKHDQKFDTLSPMQGFVSGEQARNFFLQSGLPSSVLADIWALADMNKDGKMDRLEFSIAMKLIKMKLQGHSLPLALPIIMKQPPVPAPTMPLTPLGMGSMPNLSMMPAMPVLTPLPLSSVGPIQGMTPIMQTGLAMPMMTSITTPALPSGPLGMLQPTPLSLTNALPLNSAYTSSPVGFSSTPQMSSSSLLDLGSSSSGSSSTTSLASSSPKTTPSDWAVPQASRLKYRQQFNSLDKQMFGYLSGPQVRNAMATTSLTQTQLASIWNLADVDKDGKLKADEFILAMHLVDMAKQGQPLPLSLPVDLVPPSLRGKVGDSINGATSSSVYASMAEEFSEADLPQKSKNNLTFEDRFKENLERGNAELEKRRQALLEQQRREEERRAQKARQEQERREREARELELRKKREEEELLERQKELERQREEERLKELERKEAAKKELEHQRQLEWERKRKQDLQNQKSNEQEDIISLRAKKRSLEMDLEAVGNKHKQISDKLRDAQAKKKIQKIELDAINQKRDGHIVEINSLQQQFEEFQRKLAQLATEQQKLNEALRSVNLNNIPASTMTAFQKNVTEKDLICRKLKEQLNALEKEKATKLADMDQYKKDIQDLRENQRNQEAALDKLCSVKEDKLKALKRRKQEELERKRREEEEQRRIKQEKERQWQEKLRRDEEERQRKILEEREAKLREEEERERLARLQAAREEEEKKRKEIEEEERRRREEDERRRREEEERREQERRRREEERREQERRRREEEEKREQERRRREEEKREQERRRREEEEKREQERRRREEERREQERRRREEEERRRREEEDHKQREEERKKLEEERRKLEEERKKLEEERRRQQEEKRRHEEERKEEERRKREEERKREERRRAEEELREEERRKEREEEDRRRQRAQEAAIRDAEERKRKEEERKQQEEEERRRRDEDRRKQNEERRQNVQEEKADASAKLKGQPNNTKSDLVAALLRGLEERKGVKQPLSTSHRKSASLTRFKALYPFSARNEEELSFQTGDIIEVDESIEREAGWLYGSCEGKIGWFPESYVEKQSNTRPALKPLISQSISRKQTESSVPSGSGQNSAFTPTRASILSSSEQSQVVENVRVKALCSWTAKTDNHLNFSKDDVILVLEQQENWWLGELNGLQGWFPKSYVTVLNSNDSATETTDGFDTSTADGSSLEEYVALYTYESPEAGDLTFSEGDTILVSQREGEWWRGSIGNRSGVFPSTYVKPKDTDNTGLKPGSLGKKPEVVQVTSPYTASGTGQLSLAPGQLIVILNRNTTGWWLGELQARGKKRQKGWFPASHVKQLGSNSGKSTPAAVPVCQVIAMYDYTAANGDELSFSKSQIINVLDKSNSDWWKGEVNGVTGLFPTNYVKMTTADCDPSQQWCADLASLDSMSLQEKKRQGYIHELIETEERYMEDLQLVLEVFHKPMSESGRLTEAEMNMIFVNWKELIVSNSKLLKALRNRKKGGGEKMPVHMIGDILATELSHMQAYVRFCSCQLNAAALLQQKTDQEPEFKDFLKKIATDYRCKGMPLSSFLLKPMQRITRYPLHIKNILESTPENHVDHAQLCEALEKAEELCCQVNEGVREKENSDRLEWIQTHVQGEAITENLVFNSLTNCLGPRKLLHSGKIFKTKSNKELYAFLFNDFLLFTQAVRQFTSSGSDKLFNPRSNTQYKMYKTPVFLNEVLVKLPSDPSSDEAVFHISHIDRVYILKTENINERTAWVQKIKAASEEFIETEKNKRDKAYQARATKGNGIGRLLVTVQEATELKSSKANGKCSTYCEVTMGGQCYTSRTLNDTINPKWNLNCQFHINDLYQDVLCITIYERGLFAPDDFLGRTELPVATIKKDLENKGAASKRLLLHEVPTGEVWVRLDLQLFDGKNSK